ncbi:D-alanyl-D-alanine carboxypeptidase family protein [Lentibacillus sp. CBA3610]|uniref:D-alanyl-D-alanine carboxypeptidase family protein n=1 Tax=Lentibacillus sp. CBA3610 TaxID=2518176 RepID=UPI0015951BAC|nr:D-alanyl-D-alanine carboxypeptidase family protein [Lentibacillus sp. CBA3610]QKY71131.1 carboxypeptidase [Lentibacillus sp. CBA3610]
MFKKSFTVATVLFAILFLITACSDSASEDQQTTEPAPTNQSDNQDKTEPAHNQLQLPQEHLQKNDTGDAVQSLQEALHKIDYSIDPNGTYDSMTTWAVTDYQMQQESLPVTGIFDDDTRSSLNETLENNTTIKPGSELEKPDNDHSNIVSNPHEILSLINKENSLPDGFEPVNLVVPDVRFPFEDFLPKKQMRQVAATALENMFEAADEEGLELFAQSGYRSFDRQDAIFASNVQEHGEEAANNFSARPGESEHQTGLTMDVTSPDVDFRLTEEFGETDEGQWLEQHAAEYGFIIRYPEGKEDITQYQYEPWHLRYVGEKAATDIMEQAITLEEYLR